jgi:hypothetical protein
MKTATIIALTVFAIFLTTTVVVNSIIASNNSVLPNDDDNKSYTSEDCWSHDAEDHGSGMMDHYKSSETDYDAYPHC